MRKYRLAIITFLCLFVVVLGSFKVLAQKENNIYPECLQIVEINQAADIVQGKTCSGLIFSFYGVEDYMLGDLVAVIMDDNGTPETVLDDVVKDVRYAGYID